MNKITNLTKGNALFKAFLFCLSFLFFQFNSYSQDVKKGENLFKGLCSSCHYPTAKKSTGPGLAGVLERHDKEWLYKWITNSGELIASGDGDAKAIYEEYNKVPMPAQPVSKEDIDNILAFVESYQPPVADNNTGDDGGGVGSPVEDNSNMLYVFIGGIVFLLVIIFTLNRTGLFLRENIAKEEGQDYKGPTNLWESFRELLRKNQGIVAAVVIVLFFGGLLDLMDGAFKVGVHQGYKPEQPIKFSHKIHAGDDKIDCNYCHSSARHSKTSGIPSLNVCMNCHKAIDGSSGKTFMYDGKQYSMTEEIQKIYDHLDYDPETLTYGDNPTPVKWVKVHNLPDHVFFSHSQHVTVGEQKCQTCHGPVEEMEVVEQHEPLTMKWCVECHQETAVAIDGNGYYDEMHKRMTPEFKDKVMKDGVLTVKENGGWECAKCHY